jgi:hypothetical protein
VENPVLWRKNPVILYFGEKSGQKCRIFLPGYCVWNIRDVAIYPPGNNILEKMQY